MKIPDAPNYDAKHKMIRSMFNGSRGPLLRKATALDWAGDPIEIGNRFKLGHGERDYSEMLAHFKDYNDIIGDHPQNLLATCLATNAFMLAHEPKYKQWVLEYVDAWLERMAANGGIIPTNIGLDGKIGSAAGGKWYGGVYGWGFSVVVPQTGKLAHRNGHHRGIEGFLNAFLLTANPKYLDGWRKQIDLVNSHVKSENGQPMYPAMFGDQGWYDYKPQKYVHGALEIYYLTMAAADRARVPTSGWLEFLDGKNPQYAEAALRGDLERIRQRVAKIHADTTTRDTRLADDPLPFNPASVDSLRRTGHGRLAHEKTAASFCSPGYATSIPIAAAPVCRRMSRRLIEKMSADEVTVTLVNTNPVAPRRVIVQGGAYGEHRMSATNRRWEERCCERVAFPSTARPRRWRPRRVEDAALFESADVADAVRFVILRNLWNLR